MTETPSKLDEKNFNWFKHDHTKASLVAIELAAGNLRGLQNVRIAFTYPITAIAGRNGSGKSTLLAIAACGYHNNHLGFLPFGRKNPYYTFSDFFIQSSEEVSPEGITIRYTLRHDKWRTSKEQPEPKRDGVWLQSKKKGGKWRDYAERLYRNVVYLGIQRILPDSEKSVAVNYRNVFTQDAANGWEDEVRTIVGRILGRRYDDFRYAYTEQQRYRLPFVRIGDLTYSGFNMGAGESALFNIFSTIFACTQKSRANRGVLILVDEIELGLHEEAQRRLIQELKLICSQKQVQIICTTHSAVIFDLLPPAGRIFLERQIDHTEVMVGVSAAYAMGKLAGNPHAELDIFVEDEVAQAILENTLANDLRARVNIMPIGSANALMQQLAARYKEQQNGHARDACVILDGDEQRLKSDRVKLFCDKLEAFKSQTAKETAESWASVRLAYLPGATWPEAWVLGQPHSVFAPLAAEYGLTEPALHHAIEQAQLAGKHNEFWSLTTQLNLAPEPYLAAVRARFCRLAITAHPAEAQRLTAFVRRFLA